MSAWIVNVVVWNLLFWFGWFVLGIHPSLAETLMVAIVATVSLAISEEFR
jgi:hypothetical protein